jgi:hypothetical protein
MYVSLAGLSISSIIFFRDLARHHTTHTDDTYVSPVLLSTTEFTRRIESLHRRTVTPITYTQRGWAKERR